MNEKQIYKLTKQLKRKDCKLLPDKPMFFRAILAQRLEDEMEDFVDHPFFEDQDDVLEELMKGLSNKLLTN